MKSPGNPLLKVGLSLIVIAFMMVSACGPVIGLETSGEMTDEEIDEQYPILNYLEDVDLRTTNYVLSGRVADWVGDRLFVAYIEKDPETEKVSGKLISSPDGGDTWSDPVTAFPMVECYFSRIDMIIHDDEIYYFYEIAWETSWETWELYSIVVPIHDVWNISYYPSTRLDNEYQGYMSFSQAVVFNDEVHVFWIRSHFIDCMYRVYRNDEWTPIIVVDANSLISNFGVISSDLSGTDTLYLFFMHHPTYRLYLTKSTDGVNWSDAVELLYMPDKPSKLAVIENLGKIHVVVDERNGYDIYHSSTSDGTNFDDFTKVGEHTVNALSGSSYPANVALASPEDNSTIYLAYEYDDGVVLETSVDNGDSFQEVCTFKNDTAHYPVIDHQGKTILFSVNDKTDLEIRSLEGPRKSVTDPGNDDNTTDPGDNTTDPGNDDNTTDPGNDDNTTDPGDDNNTDPQQLDPPSMAAINVDDPMFEGGGKTLTADVSDLGDYTSDDLTYEWYVDGELYGSGESIYFDEGPDEYNITLRIYYDEGKYIEQYRSIELGGNEPDQEYDGFILGLMIPILVGSIIFIITVLSLVIIRKRRSRSTEEVSGRRKREASYGSQAPSIAEAPPAPEGVKAGIIPGGTLYPSGRIPGSNIPIEGAINPSQDPISPADVSVTQLKDAVLGKDILTDQRSQKEELKIRSLKLHQQGKISDEAARAIDNIMDNLNP